jgi:nucleoid-associated protein YgaU
MSQLINKQYKNYDKVSRYSIFPYYYNRIDDKYIYGLTTHLKNENVKFVNHTVKKDDTLDNLALYYYNNPTYYWVIADFNRINDPYKTLKIGTILRIPTFSNIEFDI